ncbi:MAG: hypothetical protein IT537_25870 [Hyphomicrobiales bacterium]|nr:hypothetical protein [Hyphomicrobiales bacterium]
MNALQSHIPTEVYLDFLGKTVQIRWDYHAILMLVIWLVLVPLSIITIRYGKPRPTPYGIRAKIKLTNLDWWWFNTHKFILYVAIGLAIAGAAVAIVVSRGFSGTVHSVFGITAVVLGCLQVVSSWFRGTHGGRYYYTADPNSPATWHGDHFSMTPRRRMFEAFHKNIGYFAGFFAVGAVASGLMQYPMPGLIVVLAASAAVIIALCVVLEHQGRRHDTYRAVFGNNPEHPYNKARKDL